MKWYHWVFTIVTVGLIAAVVYLFMENQKIRNWAEVVNQFQSESITWELAQSDMICSGLRKAVYEKVEDGPAILGGLEFCGSVDPRDPPGDKCDLFECEN